MSVFFEEQGLGVFLNKLRAHGWLDLFVNTQLGCSVLELAEFYGNCVITEGVVQVLCLGCSLVSSSPLFFFVFCFGIVLLSFAMKYLFAVPLAYRS